MEVSLTGLLTFVGTLAALEAAYYAWKSYKSSRSPKVIIEAPYNASLNIRNVGTDTAKSLKELDNTFRSLPDELRNFDGPIDYMRIKTPGISEQLEFSSDKNLMPSSSKVVRFEYENSDGDKFYSEIKIERNGDTSPPWYRQPILVSSGKK